MLHGKKRRPFDRRARFALQALLLLAFVVRALIPAGYMPAADRPFTLQICPDGLPAQPAGMDHAQHGGAHAQHGAHGDHGPAPAGDGTHDHDSFRSSHCVFATVAGAGVPHIAASAAASGIPDAVVLPPRQIHLPAPGYRQQQPRGPPAFS